MKKKFISILLTIIVVVTIIPISISAETTETDEELKVEAVDGLSELPKINDVFYTDGDGNFTTDDAKKVFQYTIFGATGSGINVRVSSANTNISGDITIPGILNDGTYTYYVKEIAENAFSACRFIDNVIISEGVTTIDSSAFAYCYLKNVYIPESVTTINKMAFYSRSGHTTFFMKSKVPPHITNYTAFERLRGLNYIYVPKGSVAAYEKEGGYYDFIYELPELGDEIYLDINGNTTSDVSKRAYKVILTQVFPFKGKISSVNTSLSGEIKIPSNFSFCSDAVDVTEINHDAFKDCDKITKVIIPESVLKIDFNAFLNCTSLESATMSSNLKEIESFAFYNCSKLKEITIPYDVSFIDVSTFSECTSLKNVVIKGNLKSIKNYAFEKCYSLESITIPSTVTDIGLRAFEYSGLKSVIIPSNVTNIASLAFGDCKDLTEIQVEAYNPPSINEDSFSNDNENLKIYVKDAYLNTYKNADGWKAYADRISAYVEEIYYTDGDGNYTEDDAKKVFKFTVTDKDLKEVSVSKANNSLPSDIVIPSSFKVDTLKFDVTSIDESAFVSLGSLKSVVIPSSISKINNNAFNNCTSLKSVIMPDTITSIGNSSFSHCNSLTNIQLPKDVKTIGNYAFSSCESLEKIDISEEVTSIGNSAFFYCSELKEININCINPPTLGLQAFTYCNRNLKINVPNVSLNSYRNADNWKNYANNIYSSLNNRVFYGDKDGNYTTDDARKVFKYTVISVEPLRVSVSAANTAISKDLTIKSTFENEGNVFDVVSIGNNGFANCNDLTSINIPTSITSIGNSAFSTCENLIEVIVNSINPPTLGSEAFSLDNPNLRICVTKEALESYKNANNWQNYADKIEKIVKVDEVYYTDIDGNYTTEDAKKALKYTVIDSKTLSVAVSKVNTSLSNNINIPFSFTDGISVFNVTAIDNQAFSSCVNLNSITIPSTIISIGDHAFEYCSSLTSLTIPTSIKTIGNNTFENCFALTSITIPSSVISLGSNAFTHCDSLKTVILQEGIASISDYAFSSCDKLENVTIPSSVKTIGEGAFTNCTSLVSISIPQGVTTIGIGAFSWCEKLSDVSISNTVTTIADNAFSYCASLKEITIPYSVESIGYHAFYACRQLSKAYVQISIPQSLDKGAFNECNDSLIIYVPIGSVDNYIKANNWSDYKDRIKEDESGKGGDIDVDEYIEEIKAELEELSGPISKRSLDLENILEKEMNDISKCKTKDEVDDEVDIALSRINYQLEIDQNRTENVITGCINNSSFIKTSIDKINNSEAAYIVKNIPEISLALKQRKDIHIYASIFDVEPQDNPFTKYRRNAILFDINLYTSIDGDTRSVGKIKDIHDTNNEAITINITVDQNTAKKIVGFNKEYYVLRYHDGDIEELPCKMIKEKENYTFSFESTLFSTFGIFSRIKVSDPAQSTPYIVPNTVVK